MSELYVELYSDAPFVDARDVGVCQTPYIVDTQDSEDVFDTEGYLHVRGGGHILLLLVAVRKIEQCSGIEWIGAVLVAQIAVHSFECDYFSPIQFPDKWYTVEYESVHVVCKVP